MGMAVVYEGSNDFKTWSAINISGAKRFDSGHILYSSGPGGVGGTMWEMPDFWPLPAEQKMAEEQWVLDAVLHGQCYYVVGTYDDAAVAFHPSASTSTAMGNSSQMYDYNRESYSFVFCISAH